MTLTLQSRIEEETRRIIKALNAVDASGKKAQEAINLISAAVSGVQGAESIKKLDNAIHDLYTQAEKADLKLAKSFGSAMEGFDRVRTIIRDMQGKPGMTLFPSDDKGLKNISAEIESLFGKLRKTREEISFYNSAIGTGRKEYVDFGQQGLKEANAEAERLMRTISALQNVYETLRTSQANAKDLIGATPEKQRQDDIQRRMSEYYRNLEKTSAKEAAQAAREAAAAEREAAKEAAAAEKQRQQELRNTELRYDSLGDKVRKLRASYSNGISLGADVSKAEAEIHRLISVMRSLQIISANLKSPDWKSHLGDLGNIGSGHDTTLARRALEDQRALNAAQEQANRKAQEGIEIERKRQQEIATSAAKVRNDLASAFAGANAEAKKMHSIVSDIKSLFLQGGLVFGAQQFFNSIVQTGGEIVQQHIALRSILGDAQKADELFAQTQQLALQSPFKFGELNRDVKQLAAFGVEANDLYDTTKRLADIASGLGVSFERLGLAYGQVKARSWLDGKELRQFAYAGLPLLQKITDLYNKEGKNGRKDYTASEVKNMITKREVSFEDVQKVLWQMTDEGGQFYNMQFVLSETLLGKWNKLIDAWDIMLGKFAEGKSIIGGTFKYAIDGVTALVQGIDKISPAILSIGSVLAIRKLSSFAASKLTNPLNSSYQANVNSQLKAYAIERQRLVTEGRITQEEALRNIYKRKNLLTDIESQKASVARAAIEGRLSVLQMQTLASKKLLSRELVSELAVMGQITAKQEQIILGGSRMQALWSMTTSKMGGFVSALGGWIGVSISAITSLIMGYNSWSDKIEENAKGFADSGKQRSKNYDDFLSSLGSKDSGGLPEKVKSMKDILETSNDYTDSIKAQVESAKSLSEQYDILLAKIKESKKINDATNSYGGVMANGLAATGEENDAILGMFGIDTPRWLGWFNGLFNDDISKNVEQATNSLQSFQVMFDTLDTSTRGKMQSFINELMKSNKALASQIKGMPLAEQVRMLAVNGGKDWDRFVAKFSAGSKETEKWMKRLASRAKDSSDDVSEIMYDDVPRLIESIRKDMGMSQREFEIWARRNPEIFAGMMDKIAEKAGITSKIILNYFHKALSELLGFNPFPSVTGDGSGNKPYNNGINTPFATLISQRLKANGTYTGTKRKGKFWAREIFTALRQVQDASYETTGKNIQKELKSARDELDVMKNAGVSKSSRGYIAAQKKYDLWKSIADAGNVSDDLGKNKVTGNYGKDNAKNKADQEARKADQAELRALQARLKLIKDAYSMYKQYYDKLHDEVASAKIVANKFKGQGLSNGDITKIMSEEGLRSLMEDYVNRVRRWQPRQKSEMKDNKDSAIAEGVREMNDIDFRKMTEGMSDFSSSVDNSLKEMDRRWKSYQTFLKATGNPAFSASASGLSSDSNSFYNKGFEGLYSDYLRDYISGISPHVGGLSAEKLRGMSDEDIKKFLGSVFAGSDPKKIDGLASALKKLRDVIVDTEFQDAVNAYLSMIGKAVDEASVTGRANGEYETTKTNLDNALSMGMIDQAAHDTAIAIAKAIRDNEVLKSTASYMALSSYAGGMVDKDFESAYDDALKNLKQQLDANIISATQYTNELQKLDDLQKKRAKSGIFGDRSSMSVFAKGGLPGLLGYYNEKANARRLYLKGQGLSANDIEKDEQVSKYSNLANKVNTLITQFGSLSTCIEAINGVFNGLQQATQSLSEMFDALGNEHMANFFSDTSDVISAIGSVFSPVGDVAKSAMSGDVGGVVSNAISAPIKMFTSPITALAKLHDKKLDRQIKELERANKNIENVRNSIDRNLQNTLGGIYAYQSKKKDAKSTGSFEYYDQMYSSYEQQLSNLQARRNKESKKKKSDKGQLADYDSQIDELSDKLQTLTKDMANTLYGIDVKSWAKELTDTLVEAWASGENAAEAYGDKVRDIMKSVAKNMLSQLYVEQYFKPIEDLIEQRMKERKGKLLPEDIASFAQSLMDASSLATDAIDKTLDYWKDHGLDLSNSNSSSMTSSIKGITEGTADILASYVNAIRADVSVLRQVQGLYLPKIDVTTQAQLQQLTMISENTLRNADAAVAIQTSVSDIRDMLNRAQNNTKPFYVYVK